MDKLQYIHSYMRIHTKVNPCFPVNPADQSKVNQHIDFQYTLAKHLEVTLQPKGISTSEIDAKIQPKLKESITIN